ncbi:MAG: hypothetical protein E6J81_18450 [Deltaproteobacteria bacterium]|nr:MAG: hypothetical protein E6J81_18450 [Deltaproteobacteria bacterium]
MPEEEWEDGDSGDGDDLRRRRARGRYAEGYCLANDLEQSTGRVFQAIARIVEASPLLRETAQIMQSKIAFPSAGATITALASDYAGAAGSNPTIVV